MLALFTGDTVVGVGIRLGIRDHARAAHATWGYMLIEKKIKKKPTRLGGPAVCSRSTSVARGKDRVVFVPELKPWMASGRKARMPSLRANIISARIS